MRLIDALHIIEEYSHLLDDKEKDELIFLAEQLQEAADDEEAR